jgi:cytochrome c oxidase subunit 2
MLHRARAAALAVLSVLALLAVTSGNARAAEPSVFEIVARRFQFTPNLVTVKKGEPVVLRLRSEDVTHGFFQKELGINTTIAPGKVTEVTFTPREAGKYLIICHHFCGAGHGNMKMTVVVE